MTNEVRSYRLSAGGWADRTNKHGLEVGGERGTLGGRDVSVLTRDSRTWQDQRINKNKNKNQKSDQGEGKGVVKKKEKAERVQEATECLSVSPQGLRDSLEIRFAWRSLAEPVTYGFWVSPPIGLPRDSRPTSGNRPVVRREIPNERIGESLESWTGDPWVCRNYFGPLGAV